MKIAIHYNGVAIWRYAALEARNMQLGLGIRDRYYHNYGTALHG
jgi:hypothetical protein